MSVIRAIGLFLLTGSMTYDEIIAWAAKFYPHLKLIYDDIAEIEDKMQIDIKKCRRKRYEKEKGGNR